MKMISMVSSFLLAAYLTSTRSHPILRLLSGTLSICRYDTIKGASRRAEKSRKVLMMMKAAKLGWAGAGAGKKQGWTKNRVRKGRSRAGAGQK